MRRLLILFFCLTVGLELQGQPLKTYSGTYNLRYFDRYIGKNYGHATYSYYENQSGERIGHGNFIFKSEDTPYPFTAIYGQYTHGKRSGKWKIMFADTWGMNAFGYYRIYEGYFKNGKLDGLYKEYNLPNYGRGTVKLSKTPERQFNVHGNKIVGPIISHSYNQDDDNERYFHHRETEITGQTNERGKAHGTWIEKYTDSNYAHLTNFREYYEGICYKIYTKNAARGTIFIDYELPKDLVSQLKNTFNAETNSFIYQGDEYRLIPYGEKADHKGIDEFSNYSSEVDPATLNILECHGCGGDEYAGSLKLYNLCIGDRLPIYRSYGLMHEQETVKIESPFSIFKNISLIKKTEEKKREEVKRKAEEERRRSEEERRRSEEEKQKWQARNKSLELTHAIIYEKYQKDKIKESTFVAYRNLYDSYMNSVRPAYESYLTSKKYTYLVKIQKYLMEISPEEAKKLNKMLKKEPSKQISILQKEASQHKP